MNHLIETVYAKLPIWSQNLAISLRGMREERVRHCGHYKDYFHEAMNRYRYDPESLKKDVEERLKTLIESTIQYVPYYRRLFERLQISRNTIQCVSDLNRLPILDKEIVRKNYASLIDERYEISKLLCIHTTGTTGTPLKIFCDRDTRQLNYAYYDRFLKLGGINYKGKRATFGGRIVVPSGQRRPPFWRYSLAQKNLLFSSYHLTDDFLPSYIKKLMKFRPDIIDTYPSSLYALAKYAESNKIHLLGITGGITTSAETLFPEQRQVIESVFGVPILDQYGAAEMCVFVGQCREGSHHIHTDYGLVEFLRDDGTPANPGEEAEIVCTGFVNRIMPLIRYRIGDRGVLSEKKCACGSVFPVMEKIVGRKDDVIITLDGRRIGRLSPVLKGFPVKEAQYVQEAVGSLKVLLVKGEGYSTRTEKTIMNELKKRLGASITVDLVYVDSIPRGKGGKLKAVVSFVGKT